MNIAAMDFESVLRDIKQARTNRASAMPTEKEALAVMFEAFTRLKDLGWKNIIYCPKDGSLFHAIEAGCTGIGIASYDGEWPNGHWWMHDDIGDLWPSEPILWKPIEQQPAQGESS